MSINLVQDSTNIVVNILPSQPPQGWSLPGHTVREGTAQIGWKWNGSTFVAPTPPVPSAVSPMQFWIGASIYGFITLDEALSAAKRESLPAAIETVLAQMTADDAKRARIAAFSALEFQRVSPVVASAVAGLNAIRVANSLPPLTDADVDAFFIACAAING